MTSMRIFLALGLALIISSACTQTGDSCDDLEGTVTHSTTELTAIESVSVVRRNPIDGSVEAVDQISGSEFSNLSIEFSMSWIEEQHRFRAPSTIIQSAFNWLISPSMACSLAAPL